MIQKPSPFQTKEEYAYQALRQAILRCELVPNEKLIIDHLSTEMGLSQIPVRAAIQRLQTEGLVIINPHSSAIVAPLSPAKIDEVFVLLESLERTAFRVLIEKHSLADLTPLELLIGQMDTAISQNDSAAWLTANIAFHRKIAELTSMHLLVDFTSRVLDEWERISHFYFEHIPSPRLPQAQEEHRQIISLLRAGDAERLDVLTIAHNRAANQAYQSMLKNQS